MLENSELVGNAYCLVSSPTHPAAGLAGVPTDVAPPFTSAASWVVTQPTASLASCDSTRLDTRGAAPSRRAFALLRGLLLAWLAGAVAIGAVLFARSHRDLVVKIF